MKNILVTTLALFTCLMPLQAGDGAHGGGLGEKNAIFAYYSLSQNIGICLQSKLCDMDAWERLMLAKIKESLDRREETIDQIEFHSEKKEPGMFVLGRIVRSARTGSRIGDKIFINTDHLYRDDREGVTRAISVGESTSLLIHELSHHHGIGDGPEELKKMDVLCAKLSGFLAVGETSDLAVVPPMSFEDSLVCRTGRAKVDYFGSSRFEKVFPEPRNGHLYQVQRRRLPSQNKSNGESIEFSYGLFDMTDNPYDTELKARLDDSVAPGKVVGPGQRVYYVYLFAVRVEEKGKKREEGALVSDLLIAPEDKIEEALVPWIEHQKQTLTFSPGGVWKEVEVYRGVPYWGSPYREVKPLFLLTPRGTVTRLPEEILAEDGVTKPEWKPFLAEINNLKNILVECAYDGKRSQMQFLPH